MVAKAGFFPNLPVITARCVFNKALAFGDHLPCFAAAAILSPGNLGEPKGNHSGGFNG